MRPVRCHRRFLVCRGIDFAMSSNDVFNSGVFRIPWYQWWSWRRGWFCSVHRSVLGTVRSVIGLVKRAVTFSSNEQWNFRNRQANKEMHRRTAMPVPYAHCRPLCTDNNGITGALSMQQFAEEQKILTYVLVILLHPIVLFSLWIVIVYTAFVKIQKCVEIIILIRFYHCIFMYNSI